jgi:hypothetical protein
MLASNPASILNQNRNDLGIPNRFNPEESDSRITGIRSWTSATQAFGSVMIMVQDLVRLAGLDVFPFVPQACTVTGWRSRRVRHNDMCVLGTMRPGPTPALVRAAI